MNLNHGNLKLQAEISSRPDDMNPRGKDKTPKARKKKTQRRK